MKTKRLHFDDEFHFTSKDYLALTIAAIQVIMPYVLGFLAMFTFGVFLLVKFWLRQ